ncbi:MAG TPA: sigma-70 family RNA polymerase sigma factor, partial [Caulobacteraceae bacterium]|jgi:RNA polymerase sigma-70 factor (ECF subfamily)|nr:sigma-70 family RNA polymerase sigma factor [Caulobacteraceae bacterium]
MSQPPQPSDAIELAALIAAAGADDRRAFKALYDATSRRLFAVALGILKRRELAEDVLQEAYVRVWTQARQFDPERGPALAWLSRIVRNLAIDQIRRERGAHDDIADHADTLCAAAAPLAERADLSRGLARLRDDQRNILRLAFVQGYTHEELVDRLGVPLGTAKSRVRRGLEQLRAYFEAEPGLGGVV